MKPVNSLTIITLLLSATTALSAEINLAGRTFTVKTNKGAAHVTYASGTMTGTATTPFGTTTNDVGIWHRTGVNTICQKWNNWLNGQKQCLTLHPIGNMVKWTDQNGVTGIAK